MQSFRHVKHALKPAVKGRRRLVVAAVTVTAGFVAGALLPEARVLTGAAVATVALALFQAIFVIIDGQDGSAGGSISANMLEQTAMVDHSTGPEQTSPAPTTDSTV